MRTILRSICQLLFCFLLPGLGLNAALKTDRIEFYYGIAEGNYLIGDLIGAERGIEQMLRIDPENIPAITLKARVKLDQDQPEAALEAAERAMELEPKKLEHWLLKALILDKTGRNDKATALIRSVIEQSAPDSEDAQAARQLLGMLRIADGEWDQAAKVFNEIYQSNPEAEESSLRLGSEAFLEKARSELMTGEHDRAVDAVDQAIDVYKGKTGKESLQQSTALRMMRARLLAQVGRTEDAIGDLQILTGQQPENFEALIILASLYASVDRWESVDALIPPIRARPELLDVALYLEGRAALAENRVGTARAKFEAGIEVLPEDANSLRRTLHFYRGVCLDRLKRYEEAKNVILNALDAGFRTETAEEALLASRILLRADRSTDAIPLLEAITLNRITPNAEVWAMLGRAHLDNNTTTLAISAFNESLQINPEQSKTLALRGSLLRKIGDLEGALTDYTNALRLIPSSPVLSYEKGLVLLQLGRIAEAESYLLVAGRKLDAHYTLDLLHASCAYAIGEFELAEQSLNEYLAEIPVDPEASAHYLAKLLSINTKRDFSDPVIEYFEGKSDRKTVINWAGTAETPELAKKQICAATFWMAQYEKAMEQHVRAIELLEIAAKMGSSKQPEFQFTNWQLESPID